MKQILHETRWLGLYRIGHWDFVERPDSPAAVGILAVTSGREVILVEQFRIPLQRRVVEIPAGLIGDEEEHRGEPIIDTARRELLEETGYVAGRMEEILVTPTSAGMTSEFTHLFLATELEKVGDGGGTDREEIEVHRVPLDRLRAFLSDKQAEGCAVDGKIHAAMWAAEPLLR